MMAPDIALITELNLNLLGFGDCKDFTKKIVTAINMMKAQLTQQRHYDFGMRNLKSITKTTSELKMKNPEMTEEEIIYQSIKDSLAPRLLKNDLKTFNSILHDLFSGVKNTRK